MAGDEPVLIALTGRRPVRFRTASGGWVNNIDVSHALERVATAQFGLHQDAGGAVTLRLSPHAMADAETARTALRGILGDVAIAVVPITSDDKILQYTSDLPGSIAG
jgi:phenylacetate-CoA ligase